MKKKILSYGEILWDILPTATILGGAPFNFAYRMNTIGEQGLFVSRLGRDELGEKAYSEVLALGLDASFLQWDDKFPTGTVKVSFDENNKPDYVIIPGVAYDHVELTESLEKVAATVDCICFGTLIQRNNKSRNTLQQLLDIASECLKFLDINLRKDCFSEATVTSSLKQADILKLNENEAHDLAEMVHIPHGTLPIFCEEIMDKWSFQYCVVTLEENGAFASSADGEYIYDPGHRIDLIDSLGAGDAFSAGFLSKLLRGASIEEACQYGNILGALTAATEGATAPIKQQQIDSFSNNHFERNIDPVLEKFINSE